MTAFLLTLQCHGELETLGTLDLRGDGSTAPFWKTTPVGTAPAQSCCSRSPLVNILQRNGQQELHETRMDKYFLTLRRNLDHPPLLASPNLIHVPSQYEKNIRNSLLVYIFLIWILFVKDCTLLSSTLWIFFPPPDLLHIITFVQDTNLQKLGFWTLSRSSDAFLGTYVSLHTTEIQEICPKIKLFTLQL